MSDLKPTTPEERAEWERHGTERLRRLMKDVERLGGQIKSGRNMAVGLQKIVGEVPHAIGCQGSDKDLVSCNCHVRRLHGLIADALETGLLAEKRKCAWCGADTSFVCHAPNMCISCGDKLMADPVYLLKLLSDAALVVAELEAKVKTKAEEDE